MECQLFGLQSTDRSLHHNIEEHQDAFETDTSSMETMRKLKDWIEECVSSHEPCGGEAFNLLPKRVLEITTTHVFLREQPADSKNRARYACLSHCWGPKGPLLRHTKETTSILKAGVPLEHLPRTFMDAARVCLQLSVKYIWIDALCMEPRRCVQ
jgi:hypothetical protein